MKNILDWGFRYMLAWWLIILSPIWLPIYLAVKIKRWEEKVDAEYKKEFPDAKP